MSGGAICVVVHCCWLCTKQRLSNIIEMWTLQISGAYYNVVLCIGLHVQSCSHAVSLPTQTWSGRFILHKGTRGMDACSGLEAFRQGEEDGLLSVKKVRFNVGDRYVHISEEIRNIKEYESRSFYECYMTPRPWLRFGWRWKGYGP